MASPTAIAQRPERLTQWGLSIGQRRQSDVVYRTGYWYNRFGVVLGWGDLSRDDFGRISSALIDGELLFVSTRVRRAQVNDTIQINDLLEANPFVISRERFYVVSNAKDVLQDPYEYGGLSFVVLSQREAEVRLLGRK
jgi:hypothetical protein